MKEYRVVRAADVDVGDRYIDPNDADLDGLIRDIRDNGLTVPILVDDKLRLIDGLRRLQAFKPDTEIDVVVTDDYLDTAEILLRDKDLPGTRTWTPRRVWDLHLVTTEQRKRNHSNSKRHNMKWGISKDGRARLRERTLQTVLGKEMAHSVSRAMFVRLSGLPASAIQIITFLYGRAYGETVVAPELQEFALQLVNRIDNGYNIWSAQKEYDELRGLHGQPGIVSEKEQRQVLRNSASSAMATARIVKDVGDIDSGITVEEAEQWLLSFTQARSDYFAICKRLKERIRKG